MKKQHIILTIGITLTSALTLVIACFSSNMSIAKAEDTFTETIETTKDDFNVQIEEGFNNFYNKSKKIITTEYFHSESYNYTKTHDNQNGTYQLQTIFISQITPYLTIRDTTNSADIIISLIPDEYSSDYVEYNANYNFLITEKNYGSSLDLQNYQIIFNTDFINYLLYESDGQTIDQGNYNRDDMMFDDMDGNTTQNFYINKEINIQNNKTSYIIGYINSTITTENPHQLTYASNQMQYVSKLTINGYLTPAINYEVIDIPGLMFNVLAMPFAFISQAFNLTIFSGTPYQLNFSQLFLGIIAIAMFLWLLKVILGKADLGDMLKDNKKNDNKQNKKDNIDKKE